MTTLIPVILLSIYYAPIHTYSIYIENNKHLPYSGLFSLGANFPEFHKWTHNLGNLFWDAV